MKWNNEILLAVTLFLGIPLWGNLPTEDEKKCKCENGEIIEVPVNECIDVRVAFGRPANEPEIKQNAFFQIYAMKPSPVVFSPQGLQYHNIMLNPLHKNYLNSQHLTLSWETVDGVTKRYYVDSWNNRFEADQVLSDLPSNIRRKVQIFTYNRELLDFIFYNDNTEARVSRNQNNLQYVMKAVDANGNPVVHNPVYLDLYHDNGDFIRYSASDGRVVSFHTVTGRVVTPSTPSVGLEVINDESGGIRQVLSIADGLADVVVTELNNKYEIRLYTSDLIGPKTDGLYTVSGNPHTVWKLEKANAVNNNHLKVTKMTGGASEEFNYSYSNTANDWMLTYPDNLAVTTKSSSWDYSKTVKSTTKIKSSSDGKVAYKAVEITQKFSFGERLVATILDPDGAHLKTSYTYTDNGLTATVSNANGSWSAYSYDSNDRTVKVKSPWKNSAFNSDDTNCRVVHISYAAQDSRDSVPAADHRPRLKESRTLGITTEKSMYAYYFDNANYCEVEEHCVNPAAQWGYPANLKTVKRYYSSDAGAAASGRLERITKPDGATETYTYEYGNWSQAANPGESAFTPGSGAALRVAKTNGTASSPAGIALKTTRETIVYDVRGNAVQKETGIYTGTAYERVSWEVSTYNQRNQITAKYFSNNTYETYVWNCCSKESETLADGTQYTYAYDAMKRMVSKTKAGIGSQPDQVTTYEYDAADREVKNTIAAGALSVSETIEYNLAGQVVKRVDKQGLITTYSYINSINSGSNLRGQTITTANPGGFITVRETFIDEQVSSITGTAQISQYYDYGVNADGTTWRMIRTGGGDSPRYVKITSDLLERTVSEEKPAFGDGVIVKTNFYNAKSQLVKTTETARPDQLSLYDDLGNLIRSGIDANQNGTLDLASNDRVVDMDAVYVKEGSDWWLSTTQSTYGTTGSDAPTVTGTTRIRLSGFSGDVINEQQAIDIHGNTTIQTIVLNRTARQQTAEVQHPDSTTAEQEITINGLLVSSRSKSNLTTTYGYDALGRQTSVTDPRIGSTSYAYYNTAGKAGLIQSVTDPAGNSTTYEYDAATGRMLWEKNALNQYTRYAYNDHGQVIRIWGDTQYPVMFGYNQYGEQTNMWTFRADAAWNGQDWPSSVTGDQTIWNYDPATGLLLLKTDAAGKAVTYNYSADGKLLRRTWARGLYTDYQYDSFGQLIGIDYSDSTPDITYTYNRLGKISTVTDATGVRNFTYNNTFDLINETINGIYNKAITRTHTTTGAKGKVLGMAVDGVNNYSYGYDQYGRLNQITTLAGNFNYTRLANSELLGQLTRPNGINITWSYEPNRNLVTQVQNGTISTYGYTNDALGRRTAMSRSDSGFASPDTLSYSYDTRSQVVGALSSVDTAYDYNFTYDPIGNRLTSDGKTYTTNALNQYTAVNTETPTYDFDGNMLTNNGWTYTWNGENRLIKAEKETQKLEFAYDYIGRRVEKKVYDGTTLTKHIRFVYDDFKLTEELDALNENSSIRRYTWQPEGVGLDTLLQCRDVVAGQTYFYQPDANKNISELIDNAGNTVAHYEYSPFGGQGNVSGTYAESNPFRFSCEYFDIEIGLIYYNYRYYCPDLGRWLSNDPIEEQGGLNLYVFVENNPLVLIDELGTRTTTVEFNGPQTPTGFSIYGRASLSKKSCPESVTGTVFMAAEWQPPGLRYIKKPLSGLNIHIEVGARLGVEMNVGWNECDGMGEVSICGRFEIFARMEYRQKGARGSDGKFTRMRFGVAADGGGNLCLNLCNGGVTYSFQFNYAGYANFGYKNFNRSWNFGGGFSYGGSLGTYSQFAFMAPYCNTSPNPNSCCCKK